MNHSTSNSEKTFFKKVKNKKFGKDMNHTMLKHFCAQRCRGWLFEKIDGTLDCPMCGISQQERIEKGMRPGLDRSHVGLKFDTMLQSVMENYLMTHDSTKYSLGENVEFIKEAFVILHNQAIDCNNCAIQISCSKCNGPLEKCTVRDVKMWKSMGKDAWKEAKLQCSRKLPPLTVEVENKHLGKRKRFSDESTPRKTKDENTIMWVVKLLNDWYLKKCETAEEDAQIKVTDLWKSFKRHYNEHVSSHGFKKNYFLAFMVEKGHSIRTDNRNVRFYTGIKFTPSENETPPQTNGCPDDDFNEADTKYESLTPHQQQVFDDWFYTYCEIKVRNINPYKVIKIQLRKKAPNSYNKYCEVKGYKSVTMLQFNEAVKSKMGADFDDNSTCKGSKRCYKHIDFTCCSEQDNCDKTKNILCPKTYDSGDHDEVGTKSYASEDDSSPKTKDEQVVQLLPPLTFEPVVENKHLGKRKRFSDESESTPSEDESTPSEDESTPSEDESTPSEDEYAPSEDEYAPSEDEYAPSEDESTPSDKMEKHINFRLLQEWYLKTCETVVSNNIIWRIPVKDLWKSFTFKFSNITFNPFFKNSFFLQFMKEKGHSIEIDNHTKFYVGIKWKT